MNKKLIGIALIVILAVLAIFCIGTYLLLNQPKQTILIPTPEEAPSETPEVPEETPEIPPEETLPEEIPPENKIHFRVWAVLDLDTAKSFRDNGGWQWYKSFTIEVNIENLGNCDIHGISFRYTVIIGEIDVRGTAEIVGYSETERFTEEYFVGDLLIGEIKTFVITDVYVYWRSSILGVLGVNTPTSLLCDEFVDEVHILLNWGHYAAWKYVGDKLLLSEVFEFSKVL